MVREAEYGLAHADMYRSTRTTTYSGTLPPNLLFRSTTRTHNTSMESLKSQCERTTLRVYMGCVCADYHDMIIPRHIVDDIRRQAMVARSVLHALLWFCSEPPQLRLG